MGCPAGGGGAASRRGAGPRLVFAVLLLLSAARGENSPAYFERGQVIPVWVNSIRSPRRMDSVPMSSTPFCLAEPSVERPLSWAQRLAGDRLLLSPIALLAGVSSKAPQIACRMSLDSRQRKEVCELIKSQYCYEYILDGITTTHLAAVNAGKTAQECATGMPIGVYDEAEGGCYLNTQVDFRVYHRPTDSGLYVKGATAVTSQPLSNVSLSGSAPSPLLIDMTFTVYFEEGLFPDVDAAETRRSFAFAIASLVLSLAMAGLIISLDRRLLAQLSPSLWVGGAPPAQVRQLRDDLATTPRYATWLAWALSIGAQLWNASSFILQAFLVGIIAPATWATTIHALFASMLCTSLLFGFQLARLERHLHGRAETLPWHSAKAPVGTAATRGGRSRVRCGAAAFAVVALAAVFVLELLRMLMGSRHIPHFVFLALFLVLLAVGVPLAGVGYWLGSLTRPLFTFVDRRIVWLLSLVAIILTLLGEVLALLVVLLTLVCHYVLTQQLVVCKERRIVITPWHVSSQAPRTTLAEMVKLAVALTLAGVVPYLTVCNDLELLFEALAGRFTFESFWTLYLAFVNFCAASVLVGILSTLVHIWRKEYTSVYWRGYFAGFFSFFFMSLHATLFFAIDPILLPTFSNAVAFLSLAWALALCLGLVGGFMSFHAGQHYILRLFGHIGNVDQREHFLTLNGMRYDPPVPSAGEGNGNANGKAGTARP